MAPPPSPPCSGPDALTGALPLPLDALYEILLRLPARDLCRFRAVCRPWRALLSDPRFVAAHAALHPGPLIVTGYNTSRYHTAHRNEGIICDIMDLSGNVVKRVRIPQDEDEDAEWVASIQLDLICTGKGIAGPSHMLLNPATGAVHALPQELAKEHAAHQKRSIDYCYKTFVVFGKVASTGEFKVLRVLDNKKGSNPVQLYEVFTLDGGNHSQWRGKKGPQDIVYLDLWKSVVIGGIVYFLSYVPGLISSFDLGTEDWRKTLRGPWKDNLLGDCSHWPDDSMATLNGCLVVVHRTDASMDLWCLMDSEKSLWVKQHTIPISFSLAHPVGPLLVLDDGRIVLFYSGAEGIIRIYNPRTRAFTDVAERGYCVAVGLYTGNLLSLPTDTSYVHEAEHSAAI